MEDMTKKNSIEVTVEAVSGDQGKRLAAYEEAIRNCGSKTDKE